MVGPSSDSVTTILGEVKEVLRLWLRGKGTRPIAALVGLDRKTVQRYIAAATGAGLQRMQAKTLWTTS
jgi:hypothetical protein